MLFCGSFTADSRFADSSQPPFSLFLLHAAESSLHAAESSLHAAESSLHAAESPLHAAESSLHAAESSLHAAESSLHAADSSLHAADSVTATCRGTLLACHHNPPTVRRTIVALQRYSTLCYFLPLPLPPLLHAHNMRAPTATSTRQLPPQPIYLLFYAIC